jgi:hypothetical protein
VRLPNMVHMSSICWRLHADCVVVDGGRMYQHDLNDSKQDLRPTNIVPGKLMSFFPSITFTLPSFCHFLSTLF